MPHQQSEEGWLSVTEVLNLGLPKVNVSKKGAPWFYLERWRGKIGNELADQISRESQEIGTVVHDQLEKLLKGETVTNDGNLGRMTTLFLKNFIDPFQVKADQLEVTVKGEKLKLQGTFDAKIKCSKGVYIADWKTSNTLDKIGGPLQLSMYDYLDNGDGKGVLVRIDKESDKVDIEWYENLHDYRPVWKAALKVARYIRFGEL